MADGITHDKYVRKGWYFIIPFGVLLTIVGYAAKWGDPYLYPLFLYINYVQCHVINPDNDQLGVTLAEGIVLRVTRRVWMGFFGALFVAYSFIYAYLMGLLGGHRTWASHGWVIGTMGRMLYFSILPLGVLFYNVYLYAIAHWGAPQGATFESIFLWRYTKIYFLTQFMAWNVGDGIHLILDTEWAKGRLYVPTKTRRSG
jgi:hypothetical protein